MIYCANCHKPIYDEDDDAYVCIECGGLNRRYYPRYTFFDKEIRPQPKGLKDAITEIKTWSRKWIQSW